MLSEIKRYGKCYENRQCYRNAVIEERISDKPFWRHRMELHLNNYSMKGSYLGLKM